jgi:hypothetical protein
LSRNLVKHSPIIIINRSFHCFDKGEKQRRYFEIM